MAKRKPRRKSAPSKLFLWAAALFIAGVLVGAVLQNRCQGNEAHAGSAAARSHDSASKGAAPGRAAAEKRAVAVKKAGATGTATGTKGTKTGQPESVPPSALPKDMTPVLRQPRLALVIDDLGLADKALVERLCTLGIPVTVAVLPFLGRSRDNALQAASKGMEVILHMPMEPVGYPGAGKDPGPGAILSTQSEAEVRKQVARAMDAVPGAKGMNNHMGSRVTHDAERMKWVMQEVRRANWFFLDSRTEKDTVGTDVARKMGVPALERKVFLDDSPGNEDMARQWERAMAMAQHDDRVVIIGHIHPGTVSFLEKAVPVAKRRMTFVKASEMAD